MDKTCSKCRATKPTSEFLPTLATRDGLQKQCTECFRSSAGFRRRPRAQWQCTKCRVQKTPEDFSVCNRSVSGKRNVCKACNRAYYLKKTAKNTVHRRAAR